jgi:hypothetical protein
MKAKLMLVVFPAVAFAGAGANGGSGSSGAIVDFTLLYGTFSVAGGTNFDYVATDTPLIVDDNGNQLLTEAALTAGLDPRVYAGISQILASGATAVSTFTLDLSGCSPTPCTPVPGTFTLTTSQPLDNLAFSPNGLADISDPTNLSQIAAAAVLQNLVQSPVAGSPTPEGSVSGTVTLTEDVNATVETITTTYTIDLEQVDFSGTAAAVAQAPEPDTMRLMLAASVALFWLNRRHARSKRKAV